jgi:precorrin-3B C17-methyltransferase
VTGRLAVVGLGPGDARWLTPEAETVLGAADALFGYRPYLDRAPVRAGQRRHASDNREESARARAALDSAAAGASVALVSGGDPGVFAMAAAVCEEIAQGPDAWRALELAIVPGITAMLAVAARVGAPLGHDAAAQAGFVIALYNPISQARPWQLASAFERLRGHLPAATPTVFGRAVGRPDEGIVVTTLEAADPVRADMATLVIVGSAETRVVPRPGHAPLVYTPRSLGSARA